MKKSRQYAEIPMQTIGPIVFSGDCVQGEVCVPLATLETPLWPSTHRGALVSQQAGGIQVSVIDDRMTRSVLLEGPDGATVASVNNALRGYRLEMEKIVSTSSRFAQLEDWHSQIVGSLLYIRFEMTTGDASGHNMVTKASEALLNWILSKFPKMRYGSISGNYCTDKKVSAVNGILGRGKYVVADILIPAKVCRRILKTTPEKIVDLNIKKNLIGSIVAGSTRSANAHFANMLLGFYLATGQDVANIVEGSQGVTFAEMRSGDLYFSVTLPNIIVGTIGNGKHLAFVRENLEAMGCLQNRKPRENAKRLAAIAGGVILCGELSLLAAQTNPGELMSSHIRLERTLEAEVS